MPSLETIRTVRIKGETDGVDAATAALNRLTAQIQAANDNLAKSDAAARQANGGWSLSSETALQAANHIRQAAEAAYAFSPAFRGVVNELAAPVLAAASTAITAVAAGMVTATNLAGTGLVTLANAAEKAVPSLAGVAGTVRGAGLAMEAFSPSLAGAASGVLSFAGAIVTRLLPIVGQITLIYDAIKLVTEAWDLGNQKLAEYIDLSAKATSAGVSAEFYQRIAKAATDAKLPVDQLLQSISKLNETAADQLGGTAAQSRLQELVKAGNFQGNTGLAQLGNADTTEAKFRAIVSLIDQAMQKGQRLAALDVARSFLGDQVAANLAKDDDYLNRMLASADAIAAKDLVSQASVDNAVALQARLDAAEQILSQRWHPIQDLLVQLGIKMKEIWVDIVEAIAAAVDAVFKLAGRIGDMLAPLLDYIKQAENLLGKAAQFAGAGLGPVGSVLSLGGKALDAATSPGATPDALAQARQQLGAQLYNPNNVTNAMRAATAVESRVRGDTSIDPKKIDDTTNAYDRATESLLKYIATTNAAAETVGKGVAEQEKAKATAQLLAAAEKDGTTVTAEMRAEIDKLADRAAAAAQALEKAKIAADIKFNRDTALLSTEDVQIAQQLKGLYPDVATALGSVEAESIRVNNAMKTLSSSIESDLTSGLTDLVSGSKSAGQAFSDMSNTIIKAIEQMIIKITIVEPLMKALQSAVGGGSWSGIGSAAAALIPSAHGNVFYGGNVVPFAKGGVVDSPTMAPMALFGEAGPEAIVPLKRDGSGNLGIASSGGGRGGNVTVNVINAPAGVESQQTTTDAQGNTRVDITLKKAVDSAVGDSLSAGTGRRVMRDQYGVRQFMGQ
ncbi:hypothetical protein [Bradyrhizobium sp. SZCCHNR1020]|uniref:phage tail tape measure protein n=1 Tax=Bradyrhizobium sp. SZCCHNR1020 TaxID=3057343 RepID=UPI0029165BC3|nr:hypothetical protein [Bradyrhizobium sp. SZCCHNR1020]